MLRNTAKKLGKKLSSLKYETYNNIEISKAAILHNYRLIQELNPDQQIIPVVKSNAYGHGLEQVGQILNDVDPPFLAVDGYFEAATLLPITKHRILVMGAIKPVNLHLVDTKKCSFVVQDIEGIEAFANLNRKVNIHLELDTGMSRLGLDEVELEPYLTILKQHPKLQLEAVMSHLADADGISNEFTENQLKKFESLLNVIRDYGFKPKFIHLAQTAGSTKIKSSSVNTIRLGIGLYGINPLDPKDKKHPLLSELIPALELKSTIIKSRLIDKGDKVSYNGIFTAKQLTAIGVLPLGYYEGYPRELSNKGIVTCGGHHIKVAGRVCMNHTMIDITDSETTEGEVVTLISRRKTDINSVENICKEHGLFSYQLVTRLSEKIKRTIV